MKTLWIAGLLSVAFATAPVFADDPTGEKTLDHAAGTVSDKVKDKEKAFHPQRQRMSDCSKEAKSKGLKGPERKDFLKTCLSGDAAEAASVTDDAVGTPVNKKLAQQEKMKTCNVDAKAKGLKGQERKDFLKSCLSGSPSAAAANAIDAAAPAAAAAKAKAADAASAVPH